MEIMQRIPLYVKNKRARVGSNFGFLLQIFKVWPIFTNFAKVGAGVRPCGAKNLRIICPWIRAIPAFLRVKISWQIHKHAHSTVVNIITVYTWY